MGSACATLAVVKSCEKPRGHWGFGLKILEFSSAWVFFLEILRKPVEKKACHCPNRLQKNFHLPSNSHINSFHIHWLASKFKNHPVWVGPNRIRQTREMSFLLKKLYIWYISHTPVQSIDIEWKPFKGWQTGFGKCNSVTVQKVQLISWWKT